MIVHAGGLIVVGDETPNPSKDAPKSEATPEAIGALAQRVLKDFDKDGDGKLTREEFTHPGK